MHYLLYLLYGSELVAALLLPLVEGGGGRDKGEETHTGPDAQGQRGTGRLKVMVKLEL